MMHYSCDRCGRPIHTEDELRFVIRIEVEAVMDPVEGERVEQEDRDHLMELHEILERSDDAEDPSISDTVYRRQRFDMCAECHRKFMRNPVGQEPVAQLDFSNN